MLHKVLLLTLAATIGIGCGDSGTATNSDTATTPAKGNASSETDKQKSTDRPAVSLPEDVPEDIPIYPDSVPVYVGTSEGGIRQSPGTTIHLETTDSVEQVYEFYMEKLKASDWEFIIENLPSPAAKKGKRNLTLTIIELPDQPGTVRISLIYTRPEDAKE